MESTLAETQDPLVPPKSPKASAVGKITSLLEKVLERMQRISGVEVKKYSLEEIKDLSVVSGVILEQMYNRGRKLLGQDPYENGFSPVDLLSNLGHPPLTTSKNYFEELSPEERKPYEALQITLSGLSATEESSDEVKATRPLLIKQQLRESDSHGEAFRYWVVNPKLLGEIAAKPSLPTSLT